jgi:hypothetical protein
MWNDDANQLDILGGCIVVVILIGYLLVEVLT